MKKLGIVALLFVLAFACKKNEKPEETPVPEPAPNGTLNLSVLTFDSLGDPESTVNTKVFLSGTSYSATCDAQGKVSFSLPAGSYAPSIIRSGYEAPPVSISVQSNSTTVSTNSLYMHSPYGLTISGGNAASSTSVALTMNLNKSVPAGKSVKTMVLFSTNPGLSVHSYSVFNQYLLDQNNPNFNVSSGSIQTSINQLPTGTDFYLLAVPATGGNFYSSILGKNILLGDNLPTSVPTATIKLTKTW
ncbi:MAG: hypothetical protein K0S12_2262 [Bacteroidetes bacterium]|nr:hypothetical protein [Bacteroidota bacterium]